MAFVGIRNVAIGDFWRDEVTQAIDIPKFVLVIESPRKTHLRIHAEFTEGASVVVARTAGFGVVGQSGTDDGGDRYP